MTEQVGNYRPYHQVKIPRYFNQKVEIFLQRSIFRELIRTNIIYQSHRWTSANHLQCFEIRLSHDQTGISKTVPTEKRVKIQIHIDFSYSNPIHKQNTVQDTERLPWMSQTCTVTKDHTKCLLKGSNDHKLLFCFGQPGTFVVGTPARHNSLPSQQVLNYWSKMFPQHFKILLQFILHKEGRKKFINSRDETAEHKRTTRKWIQVAAPTPITQPACCL